MYIIYLMYICLPILMLQKKRDEYQREQKRKEQEEIDKKKQIQREKVIKDLVAWRMVK